MAIDADPTDAWEPHQYLTEETQRTRARSQVEQMKLKAESCL